MGRYCTINPKVRSEQTGELVSSKLFADLKDAVGYVNASKIYVKIRTQEFLDEHEDELSYDENGEATISSLKSINELSSLLGVRVRRTEAARQTKAYEPVVASKENIAEAEDRSLKYNSKPGNEFIALPEIYEDNSGMEIVQIRLVENTPENREEASKISRKRILVSRLSNMLSRLGIPQDALDMAFDLFRSDGFSEFDGAVAVAEGIRQMSNKANGSNESVENNDNLANLAYVTLWDSSILERIANVVADNGLEEVIMSEEELYEMDSRDSAIEASVVRLISDYILDGSPEDVRDIPELQPIVRLMERLKDDFDAFYSGMNVREINSYIYDAMQSPLTRKYESDFEPEAEVEEILNQEIDEQEVRNLSSRTKKQRKLLHDIIENNVKRYKILSSRDSGYDRRFDKDLTEALYARFQDEEYELGVYDFVDATITQLDVANQKFQELRDNKNMTLERRAEALKNLRDFIRSFKVSMDAIIKAEYAGVIKPNKKMDQILDDATKLVGTLMAKYDAMRYPVLLSFVKRFIGEGIKIPFGKAFGKEAGEMITAEELLERADKDISIFDRWLDSMAESGDIMLRMLDQAAKQARSKARLSTIDYKKKLDALYLNLKKSGITDTSFMFARDPNGHKTGKYITTKEAENLDSARKKYYKGVMEIKKQLDALLPKGSTTELNMVRVRKDYIERLKGQTSISGILRETKEALKDKVMRRSDNAETGGALNGEREKSVLTDFYGREVESLPIMFVNSKDGENIDDLSEDVTSSMLLYANMACNFSEMNNIVSLLELVREKIEERPVQQRAGAKPLVNVLKAFGIEVATKIEKTGEATNLVNRMKDWFSSQVFCRYMKDEGEIFGLDVGMLANASNELTALNQFALNILSGISNVMTASAMNRIESICGQFFSVKNLAKADMIFWKELPGYLADVGQPVKHSKFALFMEKYNTMQDYESDIREVDYAKNRFSRLMTTNSLYVINNAGELWIQNRAALALGEAYGLYYLDANKNKVPISLWDSQEVVTDENGVSRLVTKPGIKMADGTDFDDSVNAITKFTNKAKSINQRMNGIYNYEDRCAAQAYAWGRIGLMFRKWIKPSLNRRYASLNYNFDVEEWEEGFYTTTGRFLIQLIKDLKRGQLDIVTSYKNLDPREKANITRFAVECGQFISVVAAFSILKDVKKEHDGDELAKSWWFNQLLYQTRRLETEIGSQMIINPQMLREGLNIIKSPAACVDIWDGVSNMTQLLVPSNYTKTLQTGRYKGHSKAYKLFWESPLIPMHSTIYKGLHPQNSLQFYDL